MNDLSGSSFRSQLRHSYVQWTQVAAKIQVPIILLLSLVGAAIILIATRYGIGLTPDSAYYLDGARSLAGGLGYTTTDNDGIRIPIVLWPPAYPLILSLPSLAGLDIQNAARFISALIFAISIFLAGWIVHKTKPLSKWSVPVVCMLLLTSTNMLTVHSIAISEPLFLCLSLAGILTLATAAVRHSPWLFFLSGMVLGVAALTRHAGIAFIAAGVMVIVLRNKHDWRGLVSSLGPYCIAAGSLVLAWWLRNYNYEAATLGRELSWYPVGGHRWQTLFISVASWALPESVFPLLSVPMALCLLATVLAFTLYYWYHAAHRPTQSKSEFAGVLRLIVIVFIISYFLLLLVTMLWVDPRLPFERRIVLPFFVLLVILLLPILCDGISTARKYRALLGIVLIGGMLFLSGFRAGAWLLHTMHDGYGYAGKRFVQSPTLKRAVQSLNEGKAVYANDHYAFYFASQRWVRTIPQPWNDARQVENVSLAENMVSMQQELRKNRGDVVWLLEPPDPRKLQLNDLRRMIPLKTVFDGGDGFIFQVRE